MYVIFLHLYSRISQNKIEKKTRIDTQLEQTFGSRVSLELVFIFYIDWQNSTQSKLWFRTHKSWASIFVIYDTATVEMWKIWRYFMTDKSNLVRFRNVILLALLYWLLLSACFSFIVRVKEKSGPNYEFNRLRLWNKHRTLLVSFGVDIL